MVQKMMVGVHHMAVLECGTCGVPHAIPVVMYDTCFEEGGYWHCPNGHSRGFREGRHERDAVIRERDRLKQQNARLAEEAAHARAEAEKAERALSRHKKRSAAGTCACCKRTFSNMARHMKQAHPEFVASNVVKLGAVKA